MTTPSDLTITEVTIEMKARRLSAVELMKSLLKRTEELERNLNVWVTLDPDTAIESAIAKQQEIDQSGHNEELAGVPIGIKDIFYTKAIKTTACSPIYKDFLPDYDATAVTKLKDAGAVVMGKTVTTQFACRDPSPTRNPWNVEHTPGGSSSGSAAGVAARMFPAALGSQTAGSVLRPAAYNGVVGVKPTFGRVSRLGVFPVAASLDTMGCFTRTVEDAAIVLKAIAGYDQNDEFCSTRPVPDYQTTLEHGTRPPRIGILGQLFHDRLEPEIREHMDTTISRLSDAGAEVEAVTVKADFDTLLEAHRVIMAAEAAYVHSNDYSKRPNDYAPEVRALVERGLSYRAITYLQAKTIQRQFRHAMGTAVNGFDVLLTSTTTSPAPRDLTTTGDPVFQSPWTTCGFPTITVPSGLSTSGLPLGIQLGSGLFAEGTMFRAAYWCEQTLDVDLRAPV